nr:hypothetical protein CFP56_42238 [Quercus suber]
MYLCALPSSSLTGFQQTDGLVSWHPRFLVEQYDSGTDDPNCTTLVKRSSRDALTVTGKASDWVASIEYQGCLPDCFDKCVHLDKL